jgi:inosose dehydratase
MSEGITRRSALGALAGASLLSAQSQSFNYGFSLYGMKTLPVHDGLKTVADIGYKTTELCLRPTWNTEPKLLTKASRAEIRKHIGDLGLGLPSVMENMRLVERDGSAPQGNAERLRAAAEVAYECSPGAPALIETTVGGRPADWEKVKNVMRDELGRWAQTLESLKTTLAIKAHVGSAMNLPDRIAWLHDQINHPRVRMMYDYSHFALNGQDLRESMEKVAKRAAFIHVKDWKGVAAEHRFLLPGDGTLDYNEYKKILIEIGYRGPVVVEVSVHVFDQPGYDPVAAAKRCWTNLSKVFA